MTPKTCTSITAASTMLMGIKKVVQQGITHPFGDHRTVKQAFPSAIPSEQSDPFLMCDYFFAEETTGPARHEDDFPVDWHPHRGFDICSFLKSGVGRHGDSLGNRETYSTPGMQWMSTGSGVEHAEAGATPKGDVMEGFQIWVNVPRQNKMDDPRYGTVPTSGLPLVQLAPENDDDGAGPAATARVLAGQAFGVTGPFETVQDVQMIDFELAPGTTLGFDVKEGLDTAILYVYQGRLKSLNDDSRPIKGGSVVLLDAGSDQRRGVKLSSAPDDRAHVMLFAGKKLKEPIAWHGPIVMNTQEEVRQTIREIQTGQFPPKRVPWDYKVLASKPQTTS
jgi:redox-sensitive bicupin YhaK (pirin superfamily)